MNDASESVFDLIINSFGQKCKGRAGDTRKLLCYRMYREPPVSGMSSNKGEM
jgi:hypothetical protein